MKKKLIIAAAIAFAVFAVPYGSSALSTVSVASENNTVVTPTPAPSTKPVEEVKNAVDAIDASKITDAASADNAAVALIKIGSQDLKEAMNAGQDTVNDVAAIEAAYKKARKIYRGGTCHSKERRSLCRCRKSRLYRKEDWKISHLKGNGLNPYL